MTAPVVIGNATLYLGSCLEILPTLPKVDALVTDPPYGLGVASRPLRERYEASEWDDRPASTEAISALQAKAEQQIIWGAQYFDLPPCKCLLVWDKMQPEAIHLAMVEVAWTSLPTSSKMFRYRAAEAGRVHPTQKPVPLMAWCIGRTTGTVFDPYMGSGSTGIACANLNRPFVGIEIDSKYFDIACERIDQAQRQVRLFA